MNVVHARPSITVVLAMVVLAAIGALILPAFTDGDQRVIISVLSVSMLVALMWLVIRGLPRSTAGWTALVVIVFGPAYLLTAYIAVILNTPPGFIRFI